MRPTPSFQDVFPGHPEPKTLALDHTRYPQQEMLERARAFYAQMRRRRTVRQFSSEPVPPELIELAILSASTAPSGAHRQPWHWVAIDNPELKAQIREAAEAEEYKTYTQRMSEEWRQALAPLGTDYVKSHITEAPWVVVLFKQKYGLAADGSHIKNYYVDESVGIAAGMFITAIHHMGLCTLTHTPNPMGFLRELLGRGPNEQAVLLLPVGYPAEGARVPDIERKGLDQVLQWNV
jgi:nitroreductase